MWGIFEVFICTIGRLLLFSTDTIFRGVSDAFTMVLDFVFNRSAREIYPREIGKGISRKWNDIKSNVRKTKNEFFD